MLCPRCQKTVDPGAAFCGNCGFQLATDPGQQSATAEAPVLQAIQPDSAPAEPVMASPTTVEGSSNQEPGLISSTQSVPANPQPQLQTPVNLSSPAIQPASQQPYQPLQTAMPQSPSLPATSDHSGKAIASFVLGVLGLPACLIPIVGIVFGILAIVFGTLSVRSTRRVFAIIGMSLGILVLLAALFLWVRNTQELVKQHQNGTPLGGVSSSGPQQSVSTPCYTTKVPAAMKITKTDGSCTFLAASINNGEQQEVKVMQVPGLTLGNLASAAKADAANVVNAIPGGSITDQKASTFAGSQAYQIEIKATDGSAGIISYVYDTTAQGNLVIVIHTQARASGNNYDLQSIESNWSWL